MPHHLLRYLVRLLLTATPLIGIGQTATAAPDARPNVDHD